MTRSLRIARFLISSTNKIELEPGVTLKEETNYEFADEGSEWKLYDEKFPDGFVGYLSTYIYPGIGHTIGNIRVQPRAKGRGLGEKMVRALVSVYGSLSSDPQGNTSPEAIRMWQRMGAEKVPTDKNTKGYFYKLTK
jgi:ribosomal protein S18 acetylase RimI-like enzyme